MVKLVHIKPGKLGVLTYCDICNKRIDDAHHAVAIAKSDPVNVGDETELVHVHDRCNDEAERAYTGMGVNLSNHIADIAANLKLDPKTLTPTPDFSLFE